MKTGFYSPDKAKEESELKKVQNIEADKRKIYFDRLKKDKNFKLYVIDEIINYNLKALTDTSLLLTEKRTKEELADLIIANVKASEMLKRILNNLL